MKRRTKLLRPSTKYTKNTRSKNNRRTRNRIRKFTVFLIPLTILICIICGVLIWVLVNLLDRPLFISPLSMSMPSALSNEDIFRIELEKKLREEKIAYSNIVEMPGESYKISLNDGSEVIVASQKDINIQISSLQFILSRLTMEGKQFSRLDLSFDKPVIVLK